MVLMLLLDGMVLLAVLCILTGDEFESGLGDIFKAGVLALGTIIVSMLLSISLGMALPPILAIILGLTLAAVGLGYAIANIYGIELKRSMIGAGAFCCISIVCKVIFTLVTGATGEGPILREGANNG